MFYKHGSGHRPQCKACEAAKKAKYHQNNKEVILKNKRIYHRENKEKLNLKSKKYRQNNLELLKEKDRIYSRTHRVERRNYFNQFAREQRKKFPHIRIKHAISANINNALKSSNSSKNGESIKKYLAFSPQELKIHLENQFESWMNWNNYGRYDSKSWDDNNPSTWTWQIDHIIPHSIFVYSSMEDENFKKCWALDNLRPYSAKQNSIDGSSKIRHKRK